MVDQELNSEYAARLHVDTRSSKFRQGFMREVSEVEIFGFRKCSRGILGALLKL